MERDPATRPEGAHEGEEVHLSSAESRQGSVSGRVNTVHIVSGVLAGAALLLIWILYAFVFT